MPNRIIKESIKRSPEIDALSWFEEVVFYRMIVTADDYGRIDGRLVVLKNDLFPTKETVTKKAIEDAVAKLVSVGLLVPYADEVSGMPYLYFPKWNLHQRLRNSVAKYPAPPQVAASCGKSRQVAASCGKMSLARAESESESEVESESESEVESESESHSESELAFAHQNHHHLSLVDNPFGGGGDERPNFNTVESYIANNIPGMNARNLEEAISFLDDLPEDILRYAVDKACERNARNWAYVKGILNRIIASGQKTLADVKAADDAYAKARGQPKAATAYVPNDAPAQYGDIDLETYW